MITPELISAWKENAQPPNGEGLDSLDTLALIAYIEQLERIQALVETGWMVYVDGESDWRIYAAKGRKCLRTEDDEVRLFESKEQAWDAILEAEGQAG